MNLKNILLSSLMGASVLYSCGPGTAPKPAPSAAVKPVSSVPKKIEPEKKFIPTPTLTLKDSFKMGNNLVIIEDFKTGNRDSVRNIDPSYERIYTIKKGLSKLIITDISPDYIMNISFTRHSGEYYRDDDDQRVKSRIFETAIETRGEKEIMRFINNKNNGIDSIKNYFRYNYDGNILEKTVRINSGRNTGLSINGKKMILNDEDMLSRVNSMNKTMVNLDSAYVRELRRREEHKRLEKLKAVDVAATPMFSEFCNEISKDEARTADSLRLEGILKSVFASNSNDNIVSSDYSISTPDTKTSRVLSYVPKGNYVRIASKNLDVMAVNNIIFSPTEKVYTDLATIESAYRALTAKNAHTKTLAVLDDIMDKLGDDYVCVIRPAGSKSKLETNEKILSKVIAEFNSSLHQSPSHGYVASLAFLTFGKNTGATVDSHSAGKEYANYKTIQYKITEKTRFEIYRKKE